MRVLDSEIRCRWMIRRDWHDVLAIDAAGYRVTWGEERLKKSLRRMDTIGFIAETGDTVLGFMNYRLTEDKIILVRLAVHPDCRRLGVGSRLVGKLVSKLSLQRRSRLVAYVPVHKLGAAKFLSACGLLAEEVERCGKSYYRFTFQAQWAEDAEGCYGR